MDVSSVQFFLGVGLFHLGRKMVSGTGVLNYGFY